MSVSGKAIERPVATTLLTVALLLAGVLAFLNLPVSPLPEVDFPVISVGASLPGASPETMASSVATPLERQFGRIAGVNEMTSVSQLGSTSITLQFDLNRDINGAARDVQAAINAARAYLPADLPSNPWYWKVNPADSPILILALTSDVLTQDQIYDAADSIIGQKLSQVPGVGQVFIGGSSQPAVRIEANPTILNRLGLGLEALRTAVASENVNLAKGSIENGRRNWLITSNDQLKTAKDYRPIIIAFRDGGPVRLSDVAKIQDSYSNVYNAGSFNGKPSVLVFIFRQPGANIIDTVDQAKASLPFLKASLPASIKLEIENDRTQTVRASVADVEITLCISVLLVILVVFVFLREVRATLIPGIAVPLSIAGTFAILYVGHYSLDNLSLMALTISTGFVVDDAIVVIENVMRHVEAGMTPHEAAVLGSREISFTVISMSVSLMAVFIPIWLMSGIVGRLFREFAVTISAAIAVSLVASLTTTPMLCARFLKPHDPEGHGVWYRVSERGFVWMNRGYRASLSWVLRHQRFILAVAIVTLAVNVALFVYIPKGFFPQQDIGRLSGTIMGDQDISFAAMKEKTQKLAAIVQNDRAVDSVAAYVGGGSQNTGRMYIGLKPLSERHETADQVIDRLRDKLSGVSAITLYLTAAQDLRIGGRHSNAQYQYTLTGQDFEQLYDWAPRLLDALREAPQLRDVNSDQQMHGLEENVIIDRDTAARMGVTPAQIDNALYDAFGQRQISTIYRKLNQYHVVLEVDPRFKSTPDALNSVYVIANGNQVPLSSFVQFGTGEHGLGCESPGPVSRGHHLLQPCSRCGAGRSHSNNRRNRIANAAAGFHPWQLCGHGCSIPRFVVHRAAADSGGIAGGLHRARYPVRKLHPSHHDPVHAALGGYRSAACAASLSHGSGCDFAHRHYSSDRNREEERHHDDRLCAGAGTSGEELRGLDSRGSPAALPANYDDNRGRSAGCLASGVRKRNGIGATAATGHRDRGWTDRESDADALHHAGCLSVYGQITALASLAYSTAPGEA